MRDLGAYDLALAFASALAIALLVAWLASRFSGFNRSGRTQPAQPIDIQYDFVDDVLVTDGELGPFLPQSIDRSTAWLALFDALGDLVPGIAEDMDNLVRHGQSFYRTASVSGDILSITGATEDHQTSIRITDTAADCGKMTVRMSDYERQTREIADLRWMADQTETVVWREDQAGQITWANAAYMALVRAQQSDIAEISWPPPRIFAEQIPTPPSHGQYRRVSFETDGQARTWFEVNAAVQDKGTVYFATPADRLVQSEETLREFIQTLSKTFADLPIGLAIFDRRRELVLFNPSLVTLSTLDSEFLSSRPTLYNFLDQLREKRHMPEPKNYKAWRESIIRLEADAVDGTYRDLWTLPMGQTYRVIGHPHPDGAIAFMFEDITSEISLTRQFRSDLDLYQSVIDQRPEALVVFSSEAKLAISNAAYAELFDHDPREMLGAMSLREASERWEAEMPGGTIWSEVREFALQRPGRSGWSGSHEVPGRGRLKVRVVPLKAGATLLSFEFVSGAVSMAAVETVQADASQ